VVNNCRELPCVVAGHRGTARSPPPTVVVVEVLTHGSLFAGIGGIDLGFERTGGIQTKWMVENDEYCRKVLRKRFPEAELFDDVRTVGAHNLPRVDILSGGFPCQDISVAGKGAGIDGERSGLWSEFARIIGEIRPSYALIENVAALVNRGLERVLCDINSIGYDAEWTIISAADVGARHLRKRIWIVAYPSIVADTEGEQRDGSNDNANKRARPEAVSQSGNGSGSEDVADAEGSNRHDNEAVTGNGESSTQEEFGVGGSVSGESAWWAVEPRVDRVAHGVPHGVDRLRRLGNAVVPQNAELIGRLILKASNEV
jgi:DNA (cytosine-5)-methyltransferase 1